MKMFHFFPFILNCVDLFEVVVAPAVEKWVDADRRHGRNVAGGKDGYGSLLLGLCNSLLKSKEGFKRGEKCLKKSYLRFWIGPFYNIKNF